MAKDRSTKIKKQFGKEVVIVPITMASNGFYTHGSRHPRLYQEGARGLDNKTNRAILIERTLEPIKRALEKSLSHFFEIASNGEIRIEMTLDADAASIDVRTLQWEGAREKRRIEEAAKLEEEATTYLLEERNAKKDDKKGTKE